MRILKIISLFLVISFATNGQTLSESDYYQNKNENLIYSTVIEFDSVPQSVIHQAAKNWCAISFVNAEKVTVGETNNVLVVNYISHSFYRQVRKSKVTLEWQFRMVIQTKDNKIKFSFYDDGNAFWVGDKIVPDIKAKTVYLSRYFIKGYAEKGYEEGLLNVKRNFIHHTEEIKKAIESKEDW